MVLKLSAEDNISAHGLLRVLASANPRWNKRDRQAAARKLTRLNICTVDSLNRHLKDGSLNQKLDAVGEKRFSGDTLSALRIELSREPVGGGPSSSSRPVPFSTSTFTKGGFKDRKFASDRDASLTPRRRGISPRLPDADRDRIIEAAIQRCNEADAFLEYVDREGEVLSSPESGAITPVYMPSSPLSGTPRRDFLKPPSKYAFFTLSFLRN